MRFIAIAAIAVLLVLPIHAGAQVSNSQNMRALNPQPEPPGLPKQSKTLNVKKKTSPQNMRQQDMIKLNPQPEPPGQFRSGR